MHIIGFLGKKGSGKDTCSDYMVQNYSSKKIAFADPMKQAIKILFQLSDEQLYGSLKEVIDPNWNVTPRHILQYVGTEMFRNNISNLLPDIGNDFWIKTFELSIKNIQDYDYIVVSDVRFQNEVDIIHKLGGTLVKINRSQENIDSHISETEIDNIIDYDHVIQNNSTLEDLYNKIKYIVPRCPCKN